MSGVAAILLAAGLGRRFGTEAKLLAQLDGKPLVRHAAEAALASRAEPVLVVTGHRADEVGHALAGLPVRMVANDLYAEGLSTSLRAGFAALPPEAAGALILLGDMPRIRPALLDRLLAAWTEAGRPAALIPTCRAERGNPVLLSRVLGPEIARLSGDTGAGPLLRGRSDVVTVECGDPAILEDADTPDALSRLAAQASTTPPRIAE